MRSYLFPVDVLNLEAPYNLEADECVFVGSIFAVCSAKVQAGTYVDMLTRGVFRLAAEPAAVGVCGDKVYWDAANKRVTTFAGSNTQVGALYAAKSAGESAAVVVLGLASSGVIFSDGTLDLSANSYVVDGYVDDYFV